MGLPKVLAVLLLAGPAFADTAQTKDNIETVISNYVSLNGAEGALVMRRKGSAPVRVEFQGIDPGTIESVGDGVYHAVALFQDLSGGDRYYAQFEVDIGNGEWRVTRMRWVNQKQKKALAGAAADTNRKNAAEHRAAAVRSESQAKATAAKRAALPAGTPTLPAVSLALLDSQETVEVDSCPTAKCLTVYVAPWCPHCRRASDNFLKLRDYLKNHGVETRFVVGMDSPGAVDDYARTFGRGAVVDPDGKWKPGGGVPHLFVSRDGGEILKDTAGAPEDPIEPSAYAAELGLP